MKKSQFHAEKLKPVFEDKRGKIFDLIEDPISHIGLITFKKGAIRGNHYHKKSTQFTYVIDGKIELFVQDMRKQNAPIIKTVMTAGHFAEIPPHTIHTYRAVTAASMIDCTSVSRKAEGYEKDTMRVEPLKLTK